MLIKPTHESIRIYGTQVKGEGLVRVPESVTAQVSESVAQLAKQTSGIRLCFKTDSPTIKLHVTYGVISRFYHMPLSGAAGFDLYERIPAAEAQDLPDWQVDYRAPDGTVSRWLHNFMIPFDAYETRQVITEWTQPEPGLHEYTLYLPLYASVDDLTIELADDATLNPPTLPYRNDKPYVFYGSSITHGGCANKPSNSYPGFLSKMFHVDILNLGFSGSAKGELAMADYIASLDMEAFIYDYDYNAPDPDWLRNTHAAFFQRIRDQRPDLPIYILTACAHARTAEMRALQAERRRIIRQTYDLAKAQGDTNVAFLDMTEAFYGPGCHSFCVDAVHPTDWGFERMATWIGKLLFPNP